jgi:hypothetical protein
MRATALEAEESSCRCSSSRTAPTVAAIAAYGPNS